MRNFISKILPIRTNNRTMPSKLPFSNETRVYVIAEVGNNHNGSLDRAIHMVDLAKEAGADCVKFQIRNTEALYRKKSLEKKEMI